MLLGSRKLTKDDTNLEKYILILGPHSLKNDNAPTPFSPNKASICQIQLDQPDIIYEQPLTIYSLFERNHIETCKNKV